MWPLVKDTERVKMVANGMKTSTSLVVSISKAVSQEVPSEYQMGVYSCAEPRVLSVRIETEDNDPRSKHGNDCLPTRGRPRRMNI